MRGRACIGTDIDRQWTIPFGTPAGVVDGVQRAIAAFGAHDGGVILHGEAGPEVPLENIEAMYAAFYRLGTYPLTWLDEYLASVDRVRTAGGDEDRRGTGSGDAGPSTRPGPATAGPGRPVPSGSSSLPSG